MTKKPNVLSSEWAHRAKLDFWGDKEAEGESPISGTPEALHVGPNSGTFEGF